MRKAYEKKKQQENYRQSDEYQKKLLAARSYKRLNYKSINEQWEKDKQSTRQKWRKEKRMLITKIIKCNKKNSNETKLSQKILGLKAERKIII